MSQTEKKPEKYVRTTQPRQVLWWSKYSGLLTSVFMAVSFLAVWSYKVELTEAVLRVMSCHHKTPDLQKRKDILDEKGIQVVIGVGVFAVINAAVITVHHLVQKIARANNSYKAVEHTLSPY